MLSVSPIFAIGMVLASTQPPAPPPPVVVPSQTTPPAAAIPQAPASPSVPAATSEDMPDYSDAIMTPADKANFRPANRPVDGPINMVVIHDIEGTAISTVHWFQNPKSQVTAHYIIAGDGTIYQSVKEHNIAWHAGNRNVNGSAIGIEHEGYAYRPGFYNPAEYEASARLVRSITTRYSIPRDRTHIIGHFEVPDLVHPGKFGGSGGHTDPGPWWDWDSYMTLVRSEARLGTINLPAVIHPGEIVTGSIALTNLGDDIWPAPNKTTGADRGSETEDAIARRAQGLVYLGMWSPATAPLPSTSVFYGSGWTSPRFAAPVSDDIATGTETTFSLTLHGPRTLGPVSEQFRLYRLPTAPHLPVGFGPTITANVQVLPWDMVIDANSGADKFTATGWTQKPTTGAVPPFVSLQGTKKKSGETPPAVPITPATWQMALPISGDWDVYVQWTGGPKRTKSATYTVNALQSGVGATMSQSPNTLVLPNTTTISVDQRTGADNWHLLGRFHFDGKTPATITLSPDVSPGNVVVAGSVRLVGPFPAPAGAQPSVPTVIPVGAGPRPGSIAVP